MRNPPRLPGAQSNTFIVIAFKNVADLVRDPSVQGNGQPDIAILGMGKGEKCETAVPCDGQNARHFQLLVVREALDLPENLGFLFHGGLIGEIQNALFDFADARPCRLLCNSGKTEQQDCASEKAMCFHGCI